jgi:hypothetical protein
LLNRCIEASTALGAATRLEQEPDRTEIALTTVAAVGRSIPRRTIVLRHRNRYALIQVPLGFVVVAQRKQFAIGRKHLDIIVEL